MVRALLALAALALAAPVLAARGGCHRGGPPNPSSAPETTVPGDAGDIVVRAEDDGKTFDLPPGATLTFRLASHAGTGFEWAPAPLDGGVLSQVGERTNEVSSDVPGAPKTDVYRFVARSTGTTAIEMDYRRPWANQPPVQTVRVTVNVH